MTERLATRTLLQLSAVLLFAGAAGAPGIAQDINSDMEACANKLGADQIAGCTAWMKSGHLNNANAAAALYIRGYAYLGQKDYARAIADFSSSIGLKSKDANARLARANAYMMEAEYRRAITDYGDVIQLDPTILNAFNNRAWAKYRLAQYAQAITDYDTVIRRDPHNVQGLYVRGLAKAKLGRSEASKTDIAAATALDPDIASKFAKATGQDH